MVEQLFYRLPELAERWACTVPVILQLAIGRQIQICYPIGTVRQRSRSSHDMAALPIEKGARMAPLVGHIPAPGYPEIGTQSLQIIESGDPAEISAYVFKVSTGEVWQADFSPPLVVRRDDLVVLRSEVERLEREGVVRTPASPTVETAEPSNATSPIAAASVAATGTRSQQQEAAAARLAKDRRQQVKPKVKKHWQEWQLEPAKFKSKAAFARRMVKLFEGTLTSAEVIEGWCREWKNEAAGSGLPH